MNYNVVMFQRYLQRIIFFIINNFHVRFISWFMFVCLFEIKGSHDNIRRNTVALFGCTHHFLVDDNGWFLFTLAPGFV